ncbi:hypothetical protein ACFOWA_20075 [Pedobacter lithocola]|uniref:Uncharacterized protein n=1 Tax=Pedobacter lithocola TaxID=1908239 RepID=A0ABV8PH63_9SPHI
MKPTLKRQQKISNYKEFYAKAVERIRAAESKNEEQKRSEIEKDIERILDGKHIIIHGNLIAY